ncbi:MAG: tetracycline resistance MFS efflux pump [Proteobacteria bacterium SG_bin9]|nr:MAG: tetracycline resistance MFS efflux pump [Proteobacteria bacterium SG_bin9]
MSGAASDQPLLPPGPRQAAFVFIFITILLDMLALGLILPVLPKLIENFVGNDTANAAKIYGVFATAWAVMQFLCSPVIGVLSDRFGRRPVVLLSNLGLALDYVLMALAPSLAWLLIGRIISGMTSASIATSYAYVADITPPAQRAAVFGKVGAAFGAGFVLGPAVGGLLGEIDLRLPFWVAAGLSFANTLYGFLILPESLPKERRSPFQWRRANPVGALALLRTRAELAGLAVVNFIAQLAHVALPSVYVLYAGYRYEWSAFAIGLSLAFVGFCSIVTQWFVIGPVVARFGERKAMMIGFTMGALGFFIIGLAPTGLLSLLCIPPLSLWGISNPAIQGLMTRLVPPDQQGQLQGAINSVNSIAQLAGPFLFTLTFAYFIGAAAPWTMPGAPFLLAGALLLLSIAIGARVVARMPQA